MVPDVPMSVLCSRILYLNVQIPPSNSEIKIKDAAVEKGAVRRNYETDF